MDQIYIPKNRIGGGIGDYVVIKLVSPEEQRKIPAKPFLYKITKIEPIKMEIINKIFSILMDRNLENVIITGSFLERGFNFNDMDILIISEEQNSGKKEKIESQIINMIGLKPHIIMISKKALISGLETDPIYENMISRCISRERIVFNYKRKIMPRLLDLQVLKSKNLIGNFQEYNGKEKEYLVRNLVSIVLFLDGKKIKREEIERKTKEELKISLEEIKENKTGKEFEKNYKRLYDKTFERILNKQEEQNAKQK